MEDHLKNLVMNHPSDAEVIKKILEYREEALSSRMKDVIYFKKDLRNKVLQKFSNVVNHKENMEPYRRYAREILKDREVSNQTLISYLSSEKREADHLRSLITLYHGLFFVMLLVFLGILILTN